MTFLGAILLASICLPSCGDNKSSSQDKAIIIKDYEDSLALYEDSLASIIEEFRDSISLVDKAKQDSIVNTEELDQMVKKN